VPIAASRVQGGAAPILSLCRKSGPLWALAIVGMILGLFTLTAGVRKD
jgi:hypothetical protein